ncbi:PQQ-binding-like beta-propeller repeat protein [Calycomorphotria hydatis]|nr:PQQ-binding-like beta-propeller repeat protein [Calycomorphotria hydatis]
MIRPFVLNLILVLPTITAGAADWPQWQGPDRNAISPETGLLQEWPENGPALTWRVEGLGGGDSAPAVVDGMLFAMSNRDGKEIVWARSAADGKEIWATELGDEFQQDKHQSKEGPGCTPTIDGDRLYVIGMGGRIACLKLSDGEVVWQRSLVEDFGGITPVWSFRESPLVDDDKVICTPGSTDALIVALDKMTGETIWKTSWTAAESEQTKSDDLRQPPGERSGRFGERRGGRFEGRGGRGGRAGAAYSSAIAIEFEGQRQYVQLTAKALVGVAATDGELLWQYNAPANRIGINCSTPLYRDGLVFAASAYGNGGGAAKLVKGENGEIRAEEVYFSRSMQNHHGGMIIIDGALYGANGGNEGGFLTCMDFQNGDILWRDRDAPKGALLMADDRLYLRTEGGEMILIEPSREELIVRGRFDQPDRTSLPAWAHPIIADGKMYVRDQSLLLCYDVSAK